MTAGCPTGNGGTLQARRQRQTRIRRYLGYIFSSLLSVALVWLAGMFAPLVAKTLFELPNWVAMTWMIIWALLGYIFAPYGMWKHHRAQIASPGQRDRK